MCFPNICYFILCSSHSQFASLRLQMAAKYRTYVKTFFFSVISIPNKCKEKNRSFSQITNVANQRSLNPETSLWFYDSMKRLMGHTTLLIHMQYLIFYLFIIDINVTLTVLKLLNKFPWINSPIHLNLAVTIPFPTHFPLAVIKHPQTLRCESGCPNVQNTINHCGLFQKWFHSSDKTQYSGRNESNIANKSGWCPITCCRVASNNS